VTADLSGALRLDEVADVVLREGLPALGAYAGAVALLDAHGQTLELV
jgi:hypothetical protein